MRVYHFLAAQFALADIALQRIKIARLEELNDPFDFAGADLSDPELRRAFQAAKEQLSKDSGILCFSRSYRNPILWSHYADRHRGIALGFDVADAWLTPVKYQRERVFIPREKYTPEFELSQEEMLRIICTKFQGWEYEDEVRAFMGLDHSTREHGLYFKAFDDDIQLREVILGVRCEVPVPVVEGLCAKAGNADVVVRSASLAYGQFDVVTP